LVAPLSQALTEAERDATLDELAPVCVLADELSSRRWSF